MLFFFFFKQKTAYEMRISDWSSDVCSSDLDVPDRVLAGRHAADVVVQRHGLRFAVALGGSESQELGAALAVGRVLDDAFLERVAAGLEACGELFRVAARVPPAHVHHAFHALSLVSLARAVSRHHVLDELALESY